MRQGIVVQACHPSYVGKHKQVVYGPGQPGGMAQLAGCLPGKLEILNSTLSTARKKI
jgi:hypothetical protein